MANIQIPARVDYSSQPVLTTEQLANFYGVEPRRITENFKRNEAHFEEGKHYFKLEGEALKEFRLQYAESVSQISPMTRSLILWTKQGAFRHAKMLSTEKAWEVYEVLEENYFNGGNVGGVPMTDEEIKNLLFNPDAIIAICRNWQADRAKALALTAENKELKETVAVQATQITEMQPKVSYYDVILNCKDLVSISKIAKDYGMTAIEMNRLLHELGVQYREGKIWLLYKEYAEQGWSQTRTHSYLDKGEVHAKVHTYWTQKGRLGLYALLKENGRLPLIEQEDMELELF